MPDIVVCTVSLSMQLVLLVQTLRLFAVLPTLVSFGHTYTNIQTYNHTTLSSLLVGGGGSD